MTYKNFTFEEPWVQIENQSDESFFSKELRKETCKGHQLHKIKTETIARREDCDDVLFKLLDGTERFAIVHLTYSKESDPQWPDCDIFNTFGDFLQRKYYPDIEDRKREDSYGLKT